MYLSHLSVYIFKIIVIFEPTGLMQLKFYIENEVN